MPGSVADVGVGRRVNGAAGSVEPIDERVRMLIMLLAITPPTATLFEPSIISTIEVASFETSALMTRLVERGDRRRRRRPSTREFTIRASTLAGCWLPKAFAISGSPTIASTA